jgi:hypothetical protein
MVAGVTDAPCSRTTGHERVKFGFSDAKCGWIAAGGEGFQTSLHSPNVFYQLKRIELRCSLAQLILRGRQGMPACKSRSQGVCGESLRLGSRAPPRCLAASLNDG